MEEPPQDADYFVQLNELYVKFKLITRKMGQSETIDNPPIGDESQEKEDFDLSELIQASQKLTDAILGCLEAKLDGLSATNLHYYRLLAMKSSILVERSKIIASMDEDEESFKILDEALAIMLGLPARPETSYVTLRLINHFAYTLSVDEQFSKAKTVLLEGERVYALIDEDAVHAGFLASDDLFMPPTPVEDQHRYHRLNVSFNGRYNSNNRIPPQIHVVKKLINKECSAPVPRVETADYLERLATNNMQMLGFVHGRLGDWTRFVSCGHIALRRQLERREGEALAWAARAARLAQNFLSRSRYREARTHLAAATNVLEAYEADLEGVEQDENVQAKMTEVELRAGDIGRAWIKYALHLLEASSKEGGDSDSASSNSSSSSSSRSSSGNDSDGGAEVGESKKSPKKDLQEQGDVLIEVAKDTDGIVEVPVDEEGDRKASDIQVKVEEAKEDLQEQGDVVVEPAKNAVDVVEIPVDEEGDHVAPEVQGQVEEVGDAKEEVTEKKEVEESQAEVIEIVGEASKESPRDDVKLVGAVDACGLHAVDEDSDEDDADDYAFPTLNLDYIFDAVPCEPIENAEKARALTHYATGWSERVLAVYNVVAYPELHVASAMDHAELLRYLANYAPVNAAYELHRARCAVLEQVCDSVKEASPETFEASRSDLFRELADVQLEMMTLNLRRLDSANAEYRKQAAEEQPE